MLPLYSVNNDNYTDKFDTYQCPFITFVQRLFLPLLAKQKTIASYKRK